MLYGVLKFLRAMYRYIPQSLIARHKKNFILHAESIENKNKIKVEKSRKAYSLGKCRERRLTYRKSV